MQFFLGADKKSSFDAVAIIRLRLRQEESRTIIGTGSAYFEVK